MESLSRPVQRNRANFSRKLSNANGISAKNAYDDVFARPRKFGAPTFSSRVEDYSDIFGSSQGSRASSIPVLDLSDLDETNVSADFRNSTPDYSSIFVGFRDENVGMSYEELFAGPKGANSSSAKTRTPSTTKSPHQNSDRSNSLERNQSFDAGKQFNMSYHKTSQKIKDETKVTTHVAELCAVPGFTCFIDETAPLNKTKGDKRKPPAINDVRQNMDFSATSPLAKNQTKGGVVRSRSGSSWDGTYSNDKLFNNVHEIHLKSHPSNSEKSKGSLKGNKQVPRTDARDRSPDSSDEELDVNSAAAASVAALRKAIEKAQESIRVAKELMEKKEGTQVFSKKGSKSSSKVNDRRENSIAPRRNRTDEENSNEMCENTCVVLRAKDLEAAEKCEAGTGFFELVNNGKHRRAISAFEQADGNEFQEIKTTGETLDQQAEKAEVVVDATELKEDMVREESDLKISQDREENLDKFESTFVVHEVEEIEGPEAQAVEETEEKESRCEVKVEELMEAIEEEEFFESQDWDEKDQEERVNGSLELVENEHKQEVIPEQDIVEERTKDAEIVDNVELVLVKRLEEAFQWVENEIRLREAVDCYSNEPKHIDENAGEVFETGGHEERETTEDIQKEKDVKGEEYERTQVEEKIPNDACDWKESEENISVGEQEGNEKAVAGAYGYEADDNIVRESDESKENEEEMEVDDKRRTDANDGEECEKNMKEKRERDGSEENEEEIEVDEKRPTDGNDGEESEKNMKEKRESDGSKENEEIEVPEEEAAAVALHFHRVSDASNSNTSETLEEECQHEINDNKVNTSPLVSDAEGDEKDASEVLRDDGNSENFGSTDSDIGENQVEQNTEDAELASDLENVIDILVSEFRENEEIVKEDENIKPREVDEEIKTGEDTEKNEESVVDKSISTEQEEYKETVSKEELREIEEADKREREREKDRIVVERAIREARERAFAEARERAERAAVERVNAEVRHRVMAEARDKLEKASSSSSAGGNNSKSSSSSSSQKASQNAKLKSERAAVERATSEARKRALEKALLQKTTSEARPQPVTEKFPGASGDFSASSDSQSFDRTNSESYQRSKAKLEKHQRIMQRAAKALAEKNMRDLLAQKEQTERNRLSESLDADIKRWSNGKEGNLRALLSTLQYILGAGSGWQPVSLTDIITTSAVKKAYRKATLYVHPDKLQQRGASIQQKYICEKVFDLLKAAWNKFNAEER